MLGVCVSNPSVAYLVLHLPALTTMSSINIIVFSSIWLISLCLPVQRMPRNTQTQETSHYH